MLEDELCPIHRDMIAVNQDSKERDQGALKGQGTWYRIVSLARGAVQDFANAPATPPAVKSLQLSRSSCLPVACLVLELVANPDCLLSSELLLL